MADGINTYNENPLHLALKEWCAGADAEFEWTLEGYIIDAIVDGVLIEVQTRNFTQMRSKLKKLVESHPVRLVHPVSFEKWIVRLDPEGEQLSRRKSPKRGRFDQVFEELVSFPKLLANPNFSLMLLLIQEEEVRRYDATRGWRRKGWVTQERRLLHVLDQQLFESPEDMVTFIPSELSQPFTTADLAVAIGRPRSFAQKMACCLREMGVIAQVGTRTRAILYERTAAAGDTVE